MHCWQCTYAEPEDHWRWGHQPVVAMHMSAAGETQSVVDKSLSPSIFLFTAQTFLHLVAAELSACHARHVYVHMHLPSTLVC